MPFFLFLSLLLVNSSVHVQAFMGGGLPGSCIVRSQASSLAHDMATTAHHSCGSGSSSRRMRKRGLLSPLSAYDDENQPRGGGGEGWEGGGGEGDDTLRALEARLAELQEEAKANPRKSRNYRREETPLDVVNQALKDAKGEAKFRLKRSEKGLEKAKAETAKAFQDAAADLPSLPNLPSLPKKFNMRGKDGEKRGRRAKMPPVEGVPRLRIPRIRWPKREELQNAPKFWLFVIIVISLALTIISATTRQELVVMGGMGGEGGLEQQQALKMHVDALTAFYRA